MIRDFVLLVAFRTFFASSFVGANVKLQFPMPMSTTGTYIYSCQSVFEISLLLFV